jgi:hypothetical protein
VYFGLLPKTRKHLNGAPLSTRASLHARPWSEVDREARQISCPSKQRETLAPTKNCVSAASRRPGASGGGVFQSKLFLRLGRRLGELLVGSANSKSASPASTWGKGNAARAARSQELSNMFARDVSRDQADMAVCREPGWDAEGGSHP